MSEKTIGIIVVVVLIVLIVIYGIWLYVSSRNKTGFFKEHKPELGSGLYQVIPEDRYVPMTEEIRLKKEDMIQKALEKARSQRLLARTEK